MTARTTPRAARVLSARLVAAIALAAGSLASAAVLTPSHAATRDAATPPTVARTAATAPNPHGPYTTTSDQCAACHRAHTAKATTLLATGSPQSALCYTCHDGTGSSLDVESQYSDPALPANDATTASYYSHDVSKPTSHILATSDEFGGVFNRHTECGDCHDPHRGSTVDSASSPAGTPWTPSGRITGISGVSATYSGAGAPSGYTFLDGVTTPITAEYQLCFKCHSGDTKLLPSDPAHPSRDMTDVAAEFNPSNVSFHPVLAAGRNSTDAMRLSLSGPSRYKLWSFSVTDTVRCSNCHASAVTVPSTSPHPATDSPTAGSDLPAHTSVYRGILIQNYEDRTFNAVGAAFDEANVALCFLCHTDTPFTTSDWSATNFSLHQLHVSQIASSTSGVTGSIDTPGAGQGNALCAECHFRPHSTATDTTPSTGLVTFAPDVTGARTWTSATPGTGSCTLSCHGHDHQGSAYTPAGAP